MILFNSDGPRQFKPAGPARLFNGRTAILMGGSPSLKEQPTALLNQRGVLVAAMNNAAVHVRPTLWFSSDRPECYEPQILLDPTIMKIVPIVHASVQLGADYLGYAYREMPNIHFYHQTPDVPWHLFLEQHSGVPWYHNTLMSSIHILYQLGVNTIILAGSDFGFSASGDMYAHDVKLGDLQRKWNQDLYDSLVQELKILKPYFEAKKLRLMDCSKNSRLKDTYPHITMEQAVELCLQRFPKQMVDPASLPHCSKFASESIQRAIAGWPKGSNPPSVPLALPSPEPTTNQKTSNMRVVI